MHLEVTFPQRGELTAIAFVELLLLGEMAISDVFVETRLSSRAVRAVRTGKAPLRHVKVSHLVLIKTGLCDGSEVALLAPKKLTGVDPSVAFNETLPFRLVVALLTRVQQHSIIILVPLVYVILKFVLLVR